MKKWRQSHWQRVLRQVGDRVGRETQIHLKRRLAGNSVISYERQKLLYFFSNYEVSTGCSAKNTQWILVHSLVMLLRAQQAHICTPPHGCKLYELHTFFMLQIGMDSTVCPTGWLPKSQLGNLPTEGANKRDRDLLSPSPVEPLFLPPSQILFRVGQTPNPSAPEPVFLGQWFLRAEHSSFWSDKVVDSP